MMTIVMEELLFDFGTGMNLLQLPAQLLHRSC